MGRHRARRRSLENDREPHVLFGGGKERDGVNEKGAIGDLNGHCRHWNANLHQ